MEYKTLNNGLKMPIVGLGVYNISERETQRVVEDAISGIKSAHSAGIGKIIAICSEEPYEFYTSMPEVSDIIRDFDEFDRHLFCTKNLAK